MADLNGDGRPDLALTSGSIQTDVKGLRLGLWLDADLPAGPAGRALVVAESPEWARVAEVRVDGTLVPARTIGGLPAYALPAQAAQVSIEVPPTDRRWFLVQLGLVALAVFLAVPFGNRRSRRLS